MAKIFENLLGYFKLGDEDEDYEDYIEDYDEKELARLERERSEHVRAERDSVRRSAASSSSRVQSSARRGAVQELAEGTTGRPIHTERTSSNKVVPIRTTQRGLEVCIIKPGSFEDSQEICDVLLSGRAVVVNLEGFDPDDAQRIMDFISGAVYAVNGKLHQISRYIFIFSPDMIDISGDFQELVADDRFGVPTLNREF